jgi:hypothetical protein
MLAQLGVTDEHYVSRVMTDYFEGRSMNWLQVWLVLSTETWLRTHVRASSS